MKVTLEEKYNTCLALNIELEEIIEMQNKQIHDLEKENLRLNRQATFLAKELDKANEFIIRS